MVHYVSRSSQTDIQGLCKDPAPRPQALISPQAATGTPTPPDDMALDKSQFPVPDAPQKSYPPTGDYNTTNMQPSMLLKRKARPVLKARISIPGPAIFDENPRSPPPTEAVMSPLPAANKLHAGHTPILPRALSPLPPSEGPSSPGEEYLSGPLTLPPQPGDGADDTISLHVLDQELEKLRIAQERSSSRSDSAEPEGEVRHEDDAMPLSRRTSKESRKTPPDEVIDGVLLKKQRMNMGAPLGQA
ncbi:uncharacterized protein N0V89_004437 [Didymosphaeria variabile]|uniref:Uncharacterized protein n=1 Tax=Didymosphaeria variabile TaxID=1932322 RepID=A0A9W8XPW8_9PLEO|nr:uncharacterized protein N0V89_004437 [Didymosphaeria variabile]KAJ4356404.1 hypothetical protein N0V89_004437 [Didymosphaeria variabile]